MCLVRDPSERDLSFTSYALVELGPAKAPQPEGRRDLASAQPKPTVRTRAHGWPIRARDAARLTHSPFRRCDRAPGAAHGQRAAAVRTRSRRPLHQVRCHLGRCSVRSGRAGHRTTPSRTSAPLGGAPVHWMSHDSHTHRRGSGYSNWPCLRRGRHLDRHRYHHTVGRAPPSEVSCDGCRGLVQTPRLRRAQDKRSGTK